MPHKINIRFCDFIVQTQFEDIPDQALAKLFDLVIDHIGVGAGGGAHSESSEHIIKGVEAFAMGSIGKSKVYGKEKTYPTQIAALLNGAFAHSFDYDDTLAIGIIHTGASVIPAALAQAEVSNAPGTLLLTALSVGYEIKGLTSAQVYNAFGLAGSKTAGSMQFLDNGSWNKQLHPGFAAHDAFLCVALAEAGVTGASHIVEGKWGFLQAHSANVNAVGLTESLGTEWIYPATALKPFPACRFTHTAIEITARLAAKSDSQKLPDRIVVGLTRAGYGIVGEPSPNKKHPKTIVDAQFSIYYQVAVAWLFGSDIGWGAYDTDKMESKQVAQLCDRIKVEINDKLEKEFEVQMTFSGIGGVGDIEEAMVYPLGEDEHPFSHERVEKKFRGLTASIYDSDRAGRILQVVQGLPERQTKDLIELL
ncbi:hypothetical protein HER10_EVM0001802 [Colletotrichum scovillei]|uniref:uncharacterized protein n=1 Tax=Colletotrichum scovillei TaxID=1209932 RepID=UPI0015C31821|nr:uncharacterized protein HER10_EVM0001802 [Colletotrichum scovillei]KAF4774633.1 hypothetical protein HER10_EVM0001802 [Colletotrichum scovillei]